MKSFFSAPALVLCFAGSAFAQSAAAPVSDRAVVAPLTLTLDQPLQSADFGFRDSYGHRPAARVIFGDALYGGLIGLAIGTAVALIANDFNNGGWGRDLAVGAGVGIIAGGVFGALDSASSSDRSMPPGDHLGRAGGLHAAF